MVTRLLRAHDYRASRDGARLGRRSHRRSHPRLPINLCILACCVSLLMLLAPACASAASGVFGELTRFGEGGSGGGQISGEERTRSEGEQRSHLLGVDATDNSVYVLDEPTEIEQKHKKPSKEEEEECVALEIPLSECGPGTGPLKRHLRIQKFTAREGSYHLAAVREFEEEAPNGPAGKPQLTLEGIAVDPIRKRLYVLANDVREQKLKVDKEGQSGNLPVASTLFAFSTEQKEGKLLPAGKLGREREILTGPAELGAQSEASGKALLEPAGITVDPESGDLVVLAHEDPQGQEVDRPYNSGARESPDHFVLQRVHSSGEVMPGEEGRYIDRTNVLKVSEFAPPPAPNSPVVVGAPHAEQIDVAYEGGVVRIPAAFGTKTAPEFAYNPKLVNARGATEAFTAVVAPVGGELSASPYGPEGNVIYAPTSVENQQPGVGTTLASVLALSGSSGSVLGWAGAQSLFAARGAGEGHAECVLDPASAEMLNPVAAGSGGDVFVLAVEFIALKGGERLYEGPAFPAVVELGPGGRGCPQAKAGGIAAEVNGEVIGSRHVTMSEQVTFSSFVSQADARKVEWNFGDGPSETVSSVFHCPAGTPNEFQANVRQCPSARHAFVRSGSLTVTEKVFTDDLSTPTVTQEVTVNVSGGGLGPTAVATGPVEVAVGHEAIFDGSASSDPSGPNQIREYHWQFGDGQEASTTSATIAHTYTLVGSYRVSLTVTDASGLTSAPDFLPRPVAVVEPKPGISEARQSVASPAGGVGAYTAVAPSFKPVPNVRLVDASLTVSRTGTLTLALYCPGEEPSCFGTLNLRALAASSGRRRSGSKALSTLASGPFTLPGGKRKRVTLRLTAKARSLLARTPKLLAQLTIIAHDPAGAEHVTRVPALIHAASRARAHRKR